MPKEFSPILLENLQIRWSGFRVRRVALNQHMPRVERLSEHVHRYCQALLYLRGSGTQHLGEIAVPVQRGSILVIPPGRAHRFEKTRAVRPICLAIDFETVEALTWREESVLSSRDLASIERLLVDLHKRHLKPDDFSIQSAALILQILAQLQSAVEDDEPRCERGPFFVSVEKAISRHGLAGLTPGLVASHLGRSLDHLNRQLRDECGMTVGALLNRSRLEQSGRLLRTTPLTISEVASSIGMDDQNYFARWFRHQTGQTPTRWREAMRG
ncbi:MAG: AraC family transcriptional regulator [Verrucomicrobiales bacterium]|jgi:AraC family transcriptional regulator, transcriptional activator of pobA|nr:AraC family transcriptional regulator [Verrucomicrobiales bacterium]MDP4792635.1 AraC family transcriptional regulator [Verrucomicrobiales bacterium]MDP4939818.1 AraC family transcriptional regulator [Verrucomicrobiales bacterium]MDP5005586.1 AraC family transcriptional regulator [Verrucomicrobiales bacterium]